MSVQAVNGPVPQLCSILLEEPQEIADSHYWKGILYQTAAIIAGLALTIIFTGSMAVYLGMLPVLPPWAVAGAILLAIGCTQGTKLWGWGNSEFAESSQYQMFADKYNELKENWSPPDITNFFEEEAFEAPPFDGDVLSALAQKSPDAPYLALLPLIARYQVFTDLVAQLRGRIENNLEKAEQNHENGQDQLEFEHVIVSLKLEEELCFVRVKQATLLQNLLYPTKDYFFENSDRGLALKVSGQLEPLGHIKWKEPHLRTIDSLRHRVPEFFIVEGRENLSTETFLLTALWAIRTLIFDPPPLSAQEAQ